MALPVAALMAAATAAAELAKNPEVQKAAKVAWEHRDEIKEGAKGAAQVAAPVAKKAAGAGAAAGVKVAGIFGAAAAGVAKVAGDASDSAADAMKAASERRAQEKAVADARQQLLQHTLSRMSVVDFKAEWEKAIAISGILPLKTPGYFVIATYKGKPGDGKLYDYKNVFVARSEDMGASVHAHLSGAGDPDVYADAKYSQPMLVFAFPDFDTEDDNNETLRQFIQALGADESYNARYSGADESSAARVVVTGESDAAKKALTSMEVAADSQELLGNDVVRYTCRLG